MKSDSVHDSLAVWPSLHDLDSWHQAEVGGSPRLKLVPHRMYVSFRNDARGAMEAVLYGNEKDNSDPSVMQDEIK